MKRLIILATLAIGLVAAMPAAANAATWPASCTGMRCVNSHLNDLDARQRATSLKIQTLNAEVADLQSRVSTLETFKANANQKLGCITAQRWWEQYTYDYYGSFFAYLDTSRSWGQGTESGPYFVLTDSCGIF